MRQIGPQESRHDGRAERVEDEGQGLVELPSRIRAVERTAAFLERHLARA